MDALCLLVLFALAAAAPAQCAPTEDLDGLEQKSSGRSIIEAAKKRLEENQAAAGLSASPESGASEKTIEFDIIADRTAGAKKDERSSERSSKPERLVRERRKAVRHDMYRWPHASIPYEVHESIDEISPIARSTIRSAMEHWEKLTCVRFVPYDQKKHLNWLSIRKGQWCASKLGMTGGIQPLYLAGGCLKNGTVVHELGHTLGWVHEQARPDRDEHVNIKWDLISLAYKSQYDKHDDAFIDTFRLPYDYGSIMHYPSYGEIITRDSTKQNTIGQRERLSFYDIKLANLMYKCAERRNCDMNAIECVSEGYVGPDCRCSCPDGTESCTVRNDILGAGRLPSVATTPKPCLEWTTYDGAYIIGSNDDAVFGITAEECKARCKATASFQCASVDYYREKKQCFLSAATRKSNGAQFARDSRMTHYERSANCSGRAPAAAPSGVGADWPRTVTTQKRTVAGLVGTQSPSTLSTVAAATPRKAAAASEKDTLPAAGRCPGGDAVMIGGSCIRSLTATPRPVQIAALECNSKLKASLWNFSPSLLGDRTLNALIDDNGGEYWVRVANYKSNNTLSSFFEFCPYLTKESGVVVLRDNYCHRKKSFLCMS